MKNTTKKFLSMLLAVIMLLSVVPVAYAERATYPPELEQYIDFWIKIESYRNNRYKSEADNYELFEILEDQFAKLYERESDIPLGDTGLILYEYIYNKNIDLEAISRFNKGMQPAMDEVEAKIASGEIGIVINTYEYFKLEGFVAAYYDGISIEETLEKIEATNNEFIITTDIDFYNTEDFENQAEYDAAVEKFAKPYFTIVANCTDGNHIYGEYISDKNATCTEYGTKTATCEFCGATDTVTDKASGLASHNGKAILVTEATCTTDGYTTYNCECGYVYTDDYKPATGHSYADGKCTLCGAEYENCSCNCHKSGFMGFIWRIINFFNKIFGSNKICACGAEHY